MDIYTTNERLPEYGTDILLWDNTRKKWYKAQLQENYGTKYWVIEPKLHYGFDNQRFTDWTNLPENPR